MAQMAQWLNVIRVRPFIGTNLRQNSYLVQKKSGVCLLFQVMNKFNHQSTKPRKSSSEREHRPRKKHRMGWTTRTAVGLLSSRDSRASL